MALKYKVTEKRYELFIVLIIMTITILTRTVGIGTYPGGINVDEAYSGYEAWSMLNYGTDSWGYHNPVYLTVWGSGMSVLNSLLMIPFIKIGGLNTITIRLPQVIIGCISVYVMYLLLKRIEDKKTALTGMILMAICPWHIMVSRLGLDCNLAPGFLLFAAYFYIKGLDKQNYLIPSAFMWGLSLYCYATVWIVVPVLLGVWGVYSFLHKKISISKELIIACAVLAVISMPLILFVGVNLEIIPEIRSAYISIPKLVDFRADEVGLSRIIGNIKAVIKLFIFQNDGLIWNTTSYFGMYYLFSLPFIIVGIINATSNIYKSFKSRTFSYDVLIISWLIISLLGGILQGVNANKMNSIHIPLIILWSKGIIWICERSRKYVIIAIASLYMISFICFEGFYYSDYQNQISVRQGAGAGDAIQEACKLRGDNSDIKISVTKGIRHSVLLFYTQWPTDDYINTVKWQSYPERWLSASEFGCFEWRTDSTPPNQYDINTIYILANEEHTGLDENWNIKYFDQYAVAYSSKIKGK